MQAKGIDNNRLREYKIMCKEKPKLLTAKEVKKIRLKTKLNQHLFAEVIGCTEKRLKNIENEKIKITRDINLLIKIIDKKGIDFVVKCT